MNRARNSWSGTVGLGLVLIALASGCKHFKAAPLEAARTAASFDARSIADPGFKALLQERLGRDVSPWPLRTWDFPTCTLAAFYFHPDLAVARAQRDVARAGVTTAGGRPNPTLNVAPGYNFNAASAVSPWMPAMNLDLPIETAGKRRHRIARAEQLSEAARLQLTATAWQIRAALRASLVEFSAAGQQAALLDRQRGIQQDLVRLLEQRVASGAAAAIEVTPARLALIKSTTDLGEARRRQADARARLAEAVGLPLQALDAVELRFDLEAGIEAARELSSPALRRQALQGRSDLLIALSDYAAAQEGLRLEIARQYPDLHLGSGYQWDQGENKWSLGMTLELPLLNRNQGPIAEAEAKRTETAARFTALQARVIGEIDRALANHAAIREQLREGDNLVQTQHQQLTSIEAALQAGGADQLELRAAQAEAAAAELARLDVLAKTQQVIGQVEEALQTPFEALSALEQTGRPLPAGLRIPSKKSSRIEPLNRGRTRPVAQAASLPFRRLPTCAGGHEEGTLVLLKTPAPQSCAPPTGSRRNGRLAACATFASSAKACHERGASVSFILILLRLASELSSLDHCAFTPQNRERSWPVAQAASLPFRRLLTCAGLPVEGTLVLLRTLTPRSDAPPTGSRRNGRLAACATFASLYPDHRFTVRSELPANPSPDRQSPKSKP